MNPKPYLVSAAFLAAVTFGYAADERVKQNQLPAPVQKALTSSTADRGKVKEITKRTVDGRVVYDVEFEKDNAINPRLRIAEDGRVLTGAQMSSVGEEASAAGRRTAAAASSTAGAVGREMSAAGREVSAAARDRADNRRDLRSVDTESMMKLEQLPAAVRATIEKEAAGREIADIDEETWNNQKVYEVEFREPGPNSQIHVAADGKLVKVDDQKSNPLKRLFAGTQLEDTPAAVQSTIKREVGNHRIVDIDKERRTGRVVYEVEVEGGAEGKYQLHIAENGSIVKDDRVAARSQAGTMKDDRAAARSQAGTMKDDRVAVRSQAGTRGALRSVDTESMMKLEELPAAVRATIEKEAAGREIADIDEETWNKQKVYEVEFREPGLNSQIHVAADGKLVKVDDKKSGNMKSLFAGTQLEDTPAAVQATIKREVGNRRIVDIDKERRSGRVVYEVEVEDAEGKFQLHIAENGRIVKDDRVAE
jgi:uncharacterized membrane protein YkoI